MLKFVPFARTEDSANRGRRMAATCAASGCSAARLQVAGTCAACGQEFCDRHRLAEQHACAGVAAKKAAAAESWIQVTSELASAVDLVVGTLTPPGGFRCVSGRCTRNPDCKNSDDDGRAWNNHAGTRARCSASESRKAVACSRTPTRAGTKGVSRKRRRTPPFCGTLPHRPNQSSTRLSAHAGTELGPSLGRTGPGVCPGTCMRAASCAHASCP